MTSIRDQTKQKHIFDIVFLMRKSKTNLTLEILKGRPLLSHPIGTGLDVGLMGKAEPQN